MDESVKQELIKNMTRSLPMLRTALGLTQEELAGKVGVSRSTVIAIETGKRPMTWNSFLSMVLLFGSHPETSRLLGALDIDTPQLRSFLQEK